MSKIIVSLYSFIYLFSQESLLKLAISWIRISPVLFFLPFLSHKLLNNGIIKNCIIIYLILGFWPIISSQVIQWDNTHIVEIVFYELTVGIVITFVLALPFMIANIIGEFIDTQRGATISSIIDPASGNEASQFSVFISYMVCIIFLLQDGLLLLAKIFYQSYQLLPFASGFSQFNSLFLGKWINEMVIKGISLSIPILLSLFICEVALGLYSRFCPQLSAFSLSLSIKSIIAFIIFGVYFHHEIPNLAVDFISFLPLYKIFGL